MRTPAFTMSPCPFSTRRPHRSVTRAVRAALLYPRSPQPPARAVSVGGRRGDARLRDTRACALPRHPAARRETGRPRPARAFGDFAGVLSAPAERLGEIDGVGPSVITELRVVEAAAHRLARRGSWGGRRSRHGPRCSSIAAPAWRIARPNSSGSSTSTARTCSLPTRNRRAAPWITCRSIRARSSSARSCSMPARSFSCTITPRAIRRPRMPISP